MTRSLHLFGLVGLAATGVVRAGHVWRHSTLGPAARARRIAAVLVVLVVLPGVCQSTVKSSAAQVLPRPTAPHPHAPLPAVLTATDIHGITGSRVLVKWCFHQFPKLVQARRYGHVARKIVQEWTQSLTLPVLHLLRKNRQLGLPDGNFAFAMRQDVLSFDRVQEQVQSPTRFARAWQSSWQNWITLLVYAAAMGQLLLSFGGPWRSDELIVGGFSLAGFLLLLLVSEVQGRYAVFLSPVLSWLAARFALRIVDHGPQRLFASRSWPDGRAMASAAVLAVALSLTYVAAGPVARAGGLSLVDMRGAVPISSGRLAAIVSAPVVPQRAELQQRFNRVKLSWPKGDIASKSAIGTTMRWPRSTADHVSLFVTTDPDMSGMISEGEDPTAVHGWPASGATWQVWVDGQRVADGAIRDFGSQLISVPRGPSNEGPRVEVVVVAHSAMAAGDVPIGAPVAVEYVDLEK